MGDTPASAADLARAGVAYLRAGEFGALRALYHPEALFISQSGGPEPAGPDETVAALRRSAGDEMFRVHTEADVVAIDEHAALVRGQVRFRVDGGHAVSTRLWLYTARDGLIYRFTPVPGEREARELYAREGVGLGIAAHGQSL